MKKISFWRSSLDQDTIWPLLITSIRYHLLLVFQVIQLFFILGLMLNFLRRLLYRHKAHPKYIRLTTYQQLWYILSYQEGFMEHDTIWWLRIKSWLVLRQTDWLKRWNEQVQNQPILPNTQNLAIYLKA